MKGQGKKKKNAQAQKLQNEGKDTRVNHQDTQRSRSSEETIIIGDSIIKGLHRDLLSRAAKTRVTKKLPGCHDYRYEALPSTVRGTEPQDDYSLYRYE